MKESAKSIEEKNLRIMKTNGGKIHRKKRVYGVFIGEKSTTFNEEIYGS